MFNQKKFEQLSNRLYSEGILFLSETEEYFKLLNGKKDFLENINLGDFKNV